MLQFSESGARNTKRKLPPDMTETRFEMESNLERVGLGFKKKSKL